MKRRTAVAKINSLPIATEEELTKHDDVCAICYMEMTNAKVTRCRHFFHSVCLRKWLYMQDTCPLCHAVLYKEQSEKAKKAAAVAAGGAPNAAADTNDNNSDSSPEVRIKMFTLDTIQDFLYQLGMKPHTMHLGPVYYTMCPKNVASPHHLELLE